MAEETKRTSSPWRWPLRIVVIGGILYFSRAFWPLFFQGEPYAEIEATIPPEMTLQVEASYRSFDCTEMTFSDFGQIAGGKGWDKEYSPDSQGRVKVKIYSRAMGPCNWHLTDFRIATAYHKIPANVLAVQSVSDEIKKEVVKQFSDFGDNTNSTARLIFNLASDYDADKNNDTNIITVNNVLTPSIIKRTLTDGRVLYRFSYGPGKTTPEDLYEIKNLTPYGRKESLKIRYQVEVDNRILFEELYPVDGVDTSTVIQ
ncbi:hypothetical protein FHU10_3906 [Serratia fonticola]|uniref:Uncharacterized protein n=1 Tax=Serratia fonticola TaxID=47917 RepID=A0A559T9J1_SERFO|nr:hypothetical protein [Serratia fonticola]TQI81190.1 hypothetical protein FHU09_3801 [Serratia fonticola]TQI96786.1 hypothetical protein FHU11_2245 [Serratia fonticola]TVZ71282.1 hypothetical protein FHU10_3906 [Serratia fonticola]